MTSNSTQSPLPENETSSILNTSTRYDNSSYGPDLLNNTMSYPGRRPTRVIEYSYSSVLISVMLMGIIGNTLLFIMMRHKKLRTLSYSVYLTFLSVSDSVLLIIRLIREFQRLFSLQRIEVINNFLCKTFYSTRLLVMLLSPWLVVGLALDRCICVCFPLTRDKLCTQKKAITACVGMLVLSVFLIMPYLVTLELEENQCQPVQVKYYYVIFRLILSSTLPCVVILVLNILMVVRIKRSYTFRNMFTTNRQSDSATRPLVLVSVLAFVTLLPAAVGDASIVYFQTFTTDTKSLKLTKKVSAFLFIIYILNFGQNFYILIGSSSTYRNIIRRMLCCCRVGWNKRKQGKRPALGSNPHQDSACGFSLPSISSVDTAPTLESVDSSNTDKNVAL